MQINYEGKKLLLTQDPYIDGPADEKPHYKAVARDEGGQEYMVTWDVVDAWETIEDESEMVQDWDAPANVEKI